MYLANDKYNSNLSQSYTVGDTTLYVDGVPTNVPTIVTVNKGEDNETTFSVTGKTSNSLTGVVRLKGANVNLDNGLPITCLNNEEFINQYSTAIFSAESLGPLVFGEDGGSTDAYEVSLSPAPTDLTNLIGVPLTIKVNTANTGPATLEINNLTAKSIVKNGSEALETGDLLADQVVMVVYDGTNFQLIGTVNVNKKTVTVASSGTPTPNVDNADIYTVTALAEAATFGAPTGTPVNGQTLVIRIKDNGTARALDFNAAYRFSSDLPKPTTTVINKTMYLGFMWNSTDSKWDCLAILDNL